VKKQASPSQQQQTPGKLEKPANHPDAPSSLRFLCPVKSVREGTDSPPAASTDSDASSSSSSTSSTAYNVYSQPIDPTNNMPVHANNLPSFNQSNELSQTRVSSTISKGGTTMETWTYPSPQMFWNSINRKNKVGDTAESDVESVVAIHNNMNEKTWRRVVQWEQLLGHSDPKLLKFIGRPTDLSPKAYLRTLFGYPLPFDRHDWSVERSDGSVVRYIIDYYHDGTKPDAKVVKMDDEHAVRSILVDVRPAADGAEAVAARFVAMPVARLLGMTEFKQLPFLPSAELKAQQGEAQVTWDNIIKTAGGSNGGSSGGSSGAEEVPKLTKEEVVEVGKQLKLISDKCKKQQAAVDNAKGDEVARASLALTMCMANFVCPLQHSAVVDVLNRSDGVEDDGKLDVSLENMVTCIELWDGKVKGIKK
jgi:cytochrome c heme-lyase